MGDGVSTQTKRGLLELDREQGYTPILQQPIQPQPSPGMLGLSNRPMTAAPALPQRPPQASDALRQLLNAYRGMGMNDTEALQRALGAMKLTQQQPMQPHPTTGKPMLLNPGGSVSTERTITIEQDGRHYVIPTIIDGKRFTPDAAVIMFRAGKNKPVGEFGTAQEADAYARRRTMELDKALQPGILSR